jgi:MFS transporter, FHS family, L-fucose permease
MNQKQSSSFIALISVFFFWGFVAASNGILIPLFKSNFSLTQFQSQLVDLAFYAAYFFGSLIYFFLSRSYGDPINKIGYKKALIIGLLISSVGSLCFIPAASFNSYVLLLCALFVIGLGFALQQIVANPFVINFGDKKTGAHRLNLAGGINSFGTTIGPVILSYALFGGMQNSNVVNSDLNNVKTPALILFGLFILCAIILWTSKLPTISNNELIEKDLGALKFPQLRLGMIAIFMYVGVEVSIQSNLGALLAMPEIKGLDHTQISHFISLYWGSLMIGRWTGAIEVFNLTKTQKNILQFIIPFIAFAVVFGINYLYGNPVQDFLWYIPFIVVASILFILTADNAVKALLVLSLSACVMMIVGIISTGNLALYSFISGGLFCSVMWPCIFAIAINGLGKYTNQGSSLLIMMILGGAIIPPIQGLIGDVLNPHQSYFITIICFAYLAWYAYKVKGIFIKQGIEIEKSTEITH